MGSKNEFSSKIAVEMTLTYVIDFEEEKSKEYIDEYIKMNKEAFEEDKDIVWYRFRDLGTNNYAIFKHLLNVLELKAEYAKEDKHKEAYKNIFSFSSEFKSLIAMLAVDDSDIYGFVEELKKIYDNASDYEEACEEIKEFLHEYGVDFKGRRFKQYELRT